MITKDNKSLTKNNYKPESFTHPGFTLREKLEEMEMGPKEFALRTHKPEKTISAILKGESAITPDMAVKFETVLKIPAGFWMEYQRRYNEYLAKQEYHINEIANAKDWAKQFPYAKMAEHGWVAATKKIEEKTEKLLRFFGFSTHEAWKKYYLEQNLKATFRISLKHTDEAHAISAWLRHGELAAKELNADSYEAKKFKAALPVLKSLMARHPRDFFERLQQICLEAGVKVVYTPCLPKAPVNGCTRWINNKPLIQLSARYKKNDIFWFTFFHEAGHILLHGNRKVVFLDSKNKKDKDTEKENEADNFASGCLLKEAELQEIISAAPLSDPDIYEFAEKFNTHPAVIVGRLQHKKMLPYSVGNRFFEKVELGII